MQDGLALARCDMNDKIIGAACYCKHSGYLLLCTWEIALPASVQCSEVLTGLIGKNRHATL